VQPCKPIRASKTLVLKNAQIRKFEKIMTLVQLCKRAIRSLGLACALFCSLLTASLSCAADFVFIRSPKTSALELERLKTAADFYGLNLIVVAANSPSETFEIDKVVQRKETVGVAVAEDALVAVNRNTLLRSLEHSQGGNVPLLILGVGQDADPALLKAWSDGAISGYRHLKNLVHPEYTFGRVNSFTWQLSEQRIPRSVRDVYFLVLGVDAPAQRIVSLQDEQQIFPLFVETTVQQRKVFIASTMPSVGSSTEEMGTVNVFLRIAPEMMFVKYCAGERGWHVLHHYANFTIDDPWLRQPYGYVDYKSLLEEMQRHDFHTTIAFIPWNYNRSEPAVVSLFRDHPDRFSIAIHGNNHDHKEFTSYESKPLAVQIGDLKQSLARMEKFRELTGIQYDKVMVFPHSIAPKDTLAALKTYNYLATANSSNVPQGAAKPTDALFELRKVTMLFAGFPSFGRYPVAVPVATEYIAINDFLDNPLLFYAHSDFFARGSNAFDAVADKVNGIEPDTDWRSLGDMARHLYLVRLKEDSTYEVLAFSNGISLDNTSGRDSIFYLRKQESGPQIIKSVEVDGQSFPYRLQDGYLTLSLKILKGKSRYVNIQYQNDLDLAAIDVSHVSYVAYVLRLGSDFRDVYLAKSKTGLAIIGFYNDHDIKPWQVLASLLVLLIICTYSCYRWRVLVTRGRRKLNEGSKRSPAGHAAVERL
jgi:hypothetical protein